MLKLLVRKANSQGVYEFIWHFGKNKQLYNSICIEYEKIFNSVTSSTLIIYLI